MRSSGGRAGARPGAVAAAVALPAPGITLPRRRSGGSPAPARRRSARNYSGRNPGLALRVLHALERVFSSAVLDRLMRGRMWIGLLAFALIGIVAMQLVVLKLNTGIGRTLQREVLLQRENSQLGIENSVYSAENRIAPLASNDGMTLAPAGTVHFVTANPNDVARAAAALSAATQTATAGEESQTTPTASGEPGAGATEQSAPTSSETSAPSESTPTSNQASGSNESSGSAGDESGAQSTEPTSTPSPAGVSSSVTSTTPTASPSSNTAEQRGASATPSGGEQATGTGASTPSGGTQAGSRE